MACRENWWCLRPTSSFWCIHLQQSFNTNFILIDAPLWFRCLGLLHHWHRSLPATGLTKNKTNGHSAASVTCSLQTRKDYSKTLLPIVSHCLKIQTQAPTEAELNQTGAWLERANFTSALTYEDDYIKNESILLFVFKVFKQWIILRKHESTQWCLINNQFVSRNLHGHFTKHKRQVYTDHKIIVDF